MNTALVLFILIIFIYIGWISKTSEDEEYHTERRKSGLFRTAASIFTVIGAPHFAIFATLAILFGFWSIAFYVGALVGWATFSFLLVKKVREHIKNDAHSFPDIAAEKVGRSTALILTTAGLLFSVGVVVAQYIIGAQLIEAVSGVDYVFGVLAIGLVVFIYLYWGGYKAILTTDLIQGVAMFLFTVIIIIFAFSTTTINEVKQIFSHNPSAPLIPLIPLLFLGGFLASFGATSTWQRVLNAKSNQIAKNSLMGAGMASLIWGTLVIVIGIFIFITNPGINPGTAFIDFVTSGLPDWLIGVVVIALLTSLISTSDTEIFMSSILYRREQIREKNKKLDIKSTRKLISLFSLIGVFGALFLTDLQQAFGVLLNIAYIAGPIAVAIVLDRGGKTKKIKQGVFLTSLTLSTIAFVMVWIFIGDFFSWWALTIIGLSSIPLLISGKNKVSENIDV